MELPKISVPTLCLYSTNLSNVHRGPQVTHGPPSTFHLPCVPMCDSAMGSPCCWCPLKGGKVFHSFHVARRCCWRLCALAQHVVLRCCKKDEGFVVCLATLYRFADYVARMSAIRHCLLGSACIRMPSRHRSVLQHSETRTTLRLFRCTGFVFSSGLCFVYPSSFQKERLLLIKL